MYSSTCHERALELTDTCLSREPSQYTDHFAMLMSFDIADICLTRTIDKGILNIIPAKADIVYTNFQTNCYIQVQHLAGTKM